MSYIPRSEAEFDSWGNNFVNYVSANSEDLKLTPEQVAALAQEHTSWETAYQDYAIAKSALEAARQRKDNAHQAFESALRETAQLIRIDKQITSDRKVALGLKVSSGRRRARIPTTRPLGRIDASDRLSHLIYFVDEQSPTRRGKPAGVTGCEVWVKLGDTPPIDPSELQFLGTTTAAPYTARYSGNARGQTAYYMVRWVNTRGETGPWSPTFSAIIQG